MADPDAARLGSSGLDCRRREFCHFTDVPSPSVLRHLLQGRGVIVTRVCSRISALSGAGSDREWFSSDTDEDEFLLSAGRVAAAAAAAAAVAAAAAGGAAGGRG